MIKFGELYNINFAWDDNTVLTVRVNDNITSFDMNAFDVLCKYKDSLVELFNENYVRLNVIDKEGVKNDSSRNNVQ